MRTLNDYHLTLHLDDMGTAATQWCVPVPDAGTVNIVYTALDAALTTGDNTLTIKDAAGSSMGTIVMTQSGSAVGDVDSLSPTANNTVAAGDFIEIETDAGCGAGESATVTIVIRR